MKSINQVSGKGFLEIAWQDGKAVLTTVTKDSEMAYDFFQVLERFNNKQIAFSIKEENEVETLDEQ